MPLKIATGKQGVVWHGSFFVHHSLALVNRELSLAMLADPAFAGRFDLGIQPYEPDTFSPETESRFAALAALQNRLPDDPMVTIRHRWPPDFTRTETGKLVLIQPWEFGSLPKIWVEAFADTVDEVWVPSNFVRETYVLSGVAAEKVFVVPNGVNTERFHPNVEPFDFAAHEDTKHITSETYKFLFVGGTIARKGIDVLLDAYDRAFTSRDDVTLIIKDFGTNSFYANQSAEMLIRALQAKPGGANIVYLNRDMSEDEIASLYAACDCLAHPYRGEGYGLPIAEAMACGKPAILTGAGAALDFANDGNAYLIPSTPQRLPDNKISGMETVAQPWWSEPDRESLRNLLRRVSENRDEAKAIGAKAAADIASRHTWKHAADIASGRLKELADGGAAIGQRVAPPISLSSLNLGGLNVMNSLGDLPGLNALGDTYETRKQAALAETRSGRWQDAADQLEACLVERPDDWDAINALAVVYFRQGDKGKAVDLLERGIASAPNVRDFHHNLAFIQLQTGNSEEGLVHAVKAMELTPDNADVRRTVQRAQDGVLKLARKVLRGYPDKQRSQAKQDPRYLELMQAYNDAEERLKQPVGAPVASGPKLSLVMIVKNEERFLRNCLESAKDIVDEIVIVDTGSSDSTLDIAREFNAKIVSHIWEDDFSAARNVSISHATGDWALWLDADEEIGPGTGAAFRETMKNAPANVGAYMVEICNYLQSTVRKEDTEKAVHHACRLFRLVPGLRFEGRIHEQNLRSLQQLGYTYARKQGMRIDHFGYAGEIMNLRNKHERFIRMLKREVDECPEEGFRHFHLFNLGNAYFTQGDLHNAAHYLGLAAEKPDVTEEFTVTLFTELATSLHRLGRSPEGLKVCEKADELGLKEPSIEFARGYCLLHVKRYEEAEMAFHAALGMKVEDSEFGRTGDQGVRGFKALYGLGLALVGQDRYQEAIAPCEKALAEQATFNDARYLLSIAFTNCDREEDALNQLETVLHYQPDHDDAIRDLAKLRYNRAEYAAALPHLRWLVQHQFDDRDNVARLAKCCDELGLAEEARSYYERLRAMEPGSVEICVNLGRVLAATGATDEAIDCFADAIHMDPKYANAYFNAGDVLYGLGIYALAADTYIGGLEVAPDTATGYFMLGNCYVNTRDYQAATVAFRQALALDPVYKEAQNNLEVAEGLAEEERKATQAA